MAKRASQETDEERLVRVTREAREAIRDAVDASRTLREMKSKTLTEVRQACDAAIEDIAEGIGEIGNHRMAVQTQFANKLIEQILETVTRVIEENNDDLTLAVGTSFAAERRLARGDWGVMP